MDVPILDSGREKEGLVDNAGEQQEEDEDDKEFVFGVMVVLVVLVVPLEEEFLEDNVPGSYVSLDVEKEEEEEEG